MTRATARRTDRRYFARRQAAILEPSLPARRMQSSCRCTWLRLGVVAGFVGVGTVVGAVGVVVCGTVGVVAAPGVAVNASTWPPARSAE
jgi:hypothetical protein